MSSKSPYIGSRINLISKSEIRYEGTLFAVDSQASTISLSKVRSFGTEDRPSSRPVKAREEVFEYVIFKATDIKDLVVMEDISPSELTVFDPAIVSMAKSSRPSHTPQHHERNGGFNYSSQRHRQLNSYPNIGGYNNYNSKSQSLHVAFKEKLQFDSDYDFVKANEQFEKTINGFATDEKKDSQDHKDENEEPSIESSQKNEEVKSFYNKDSFFDEISCEALEKAEGKYSRPNWRKERQTNQETFGPNAVRNQNQYHQRRMPQNRYMNPRPGNRFYGNCALPSHSFYPKTRNSNYIRI